MHLVWILLALVPISTAVEVSTKLGVIHGKVLQTRLGNDFFAFRGIRYAQAPVGKLRFKNPQPVLPWDPASFDATQDGPICPQSTKNKTSYSEDCLRLNVYTKDLSPMKLRSVLVFLHPGGFYGFSAHSEKFAGPQILMDRDIVLVTVNYRLGTLGFLATGTKHAPGNAGLKDQAVALRWVKEHIQNFGGDPNSVTLFGYSAGSLSIGLHLISPMSKGLFHRAIGMSASPIPQSNYTYSQFGLATKQARLVGCPTDSEGSIAKMVECLENTPVDEFVRTSPEMFDFGYNPILLWLPVIEHNHGQEMFINEDPFQAYQTGNFHRMPLIIGMTKDEFVRIPYYILRNSTMTQQLNNDWERLAPIILQYERETTRSKTISNTLRAQYLGNKPLTPDSFIELGELFSDGVIGFGVHRWAHLAAKHTPVYYYKFSYRGRYSWFNLPPKNEPYGATHHDDLLYLLHTPSIAPLFSKDDPENETVERMTRMWTHFAATGNPNNKTDDYLKSLDWQPLDLDKENFLEIGQELTNRDHLYTDRFSRWESLFPLS